MHFHFKCVSLCACAFVPFDSLLERVLLNVTLLAMLGSLIFVWARICKSLCTNVHMCC